MVWRKLSKVVKHMYLKGLMGVENNIVSHIPIYVTVAKENMLP